MLYAVISLGLGVAALGIFALLRRSSAHDHGDRVAPHVLTRINNDYNDTRH